MNGVEILNSFEVATKYSFNWTAAFIGFGIIFGIILFVCLLCDEDFVYGIILCLFFGLLTFGLCGFEYQKPVETEVHHKATISDDVNFNEFNEKYEIVNQEGKIFTIRERLEQGE